MQYGNIAITRIIKMEFLPVKSSDVFTHTDQLLFNSAFEYGGMNDLPASFTAAQMMVFYNQWLGNLPPVYNARKIESARRMATLLSASDFISTLPDRASGGVKKYGLNSAYWVMIDDEVI